MLRVAVVAALVAVCLARLPKSELDSEWQLYLKAHGKQYEAEDEARR